MPETAEVMADAGMLARAGNPAAFADAIRTLVRDGARREGLRRRALDLSATRGWDAVFDRLEDDYLKAIARHRTATQGISKG